MGLKTSINQSKNMTSPITESASTIDTFNWVLASASRCSLTESELFKTIVINAFLGNLIAKPPFWKLMLISVWRVVSVLQQLSSADEINDLLNLLDTHQIWRIVRNSIKNQAKLIGSFYEHLAMETQSNKGSSSTFNTGHIASRKEAEEMLNSNFVWLEARLSGIDTKLTRFRTALRAWIETASNESYEAGLLGSILGGLLLGPVGAFAGAVLGSSGN
jgi:hypothetical protein